MGVRMHKETFDQKYGSKRLYWGTKPSDLVRNYASLATPGRAVDLGMGEGRDSIFLAQRGFTVTGVEQSEIGVAKCLKRSDKLGVNIKTSICDVRHFKIAKSKYSLILSSNLFQFITKSEAHDVAHNIISGLKKGGLVIATVFTYDDPRYKEYRKKTTELEPGTFLLVSGDICSLYDYGELMEFFKPLRIFHYSEYNYFDARGGTKGHWHGVAELVAKKM